MIPDGFDWDGLLPAGEYPATIAELRGSLLVKGPEPKPADWDSEWRRELVDNLAVLAKQLWQAGVTKIFINGSFVGDVGHPHDIDGYFECDSDEFFSRRLQQHLDSLEPGIWIWD